jgi:23S rRNA (adenine2503-C2)-methyltransferase
MIDIHDSAGLELLRQKLRIDPGHLRRFKNAFYKKQQIEDAALDSIPEWQRAAFKNEIAFHALEFCSRRDSHIDGASKLLFRTAAGHLLESVILRIATGRNTVCVSSQVGCAVGCRFCSTGQMGMNLNLSCSEILDQVIQANRILRAEGERAVRNVVFMGMGEPLLNEPEVFRALDILLSPSCFDLAPGRVLLSSVGLPDALVRCAGRFPRLGMALSLHSASQSQRERLIPLARRHPLQALHEAIKRVNSIQQRPLMVEYLLLEGLTDTEAELAALVDYLRGLRVHINLIPFNPVTHAPELAGTPLERRRSFAETLRRNGLKVTVRYSQGADITAACGQLVLLEHARYVGRHFKGEENEARPWLA